MADLCYDTDTDAPLRCAAVVDAGCVKALIALLHSHHGHPDSPINVNVADALRLLAIGMANTSASLFSVTIVTDTFSAQPSRPRLR